jgi:acetyl-CoA carboxylase carboxyl transferase subunit alpha
MLQYGIYSVISPEGCASILWKSSDKAAEAADAMGVTADRLIKLGLVDEIVQEPLGGAHRDLDTMAERLKDSIIRNLRQLQSLSVADLVKQRYQRLMSYGQTHL